ncbi:hypothetical protein OCL06_12270 [Alteromonas sp. ASW11-19]|uniref:Uncharacterized protein n=1 Tax=Alteromonas salexigens TaxID=2982530 RepID=A0ABT2VPW7_9ALTE|nr:hypothetical protein [Alteromonas salexigens]MCU7555363.1 hypothetical protein [Alteromonas salexigens]
MTKNKIQNHVRERIGEKLQRKGSLTKIMAYLSGSSTPKVEATYAPDLSLLNNTSNNPDIAAA